MADWTPTRGSLVAYKDELYYFQPNGTSCYLFASLANMGIAGAHVHAVARASIREPTKADIDAFVDKQASLVTVKHKAGGSRTPEADAFLAGKYDKLERLITEETAPLVPPSSSTTTELSELERLQKENVALLFEVERLTRLLKESQSVVARYDEQQTQAVTVEFKVTVRDGKVVEYERVGDGAEKK